VTTIRFHDPEVRISAALAQALAAVRDPVITLRELFVLLGEQGLLMFCGVLAAPFLLPVTVPMMSTAFGIPMLLIGFSVMVSRVPWLPERLLDRRLSTPHVRQVLRKVHGWALRFEHLVRPRLLGLSGGATINFVNGGLIMLAVALLMAPLPLVPLVNTLPAIAVMLLCFGMAGRLACISFWYSGSLIYRYRGRKRPRADLCKVQIVCAMKWLVTNADSP
jgi:hypothetical protein